MIVVHVSKLICTIWNSLLNYVLLYMFWSTVGRCPLHKLSRPHSVMDNMWTATQRTTGLIWRIVKEAIIDTFRESNQGQ
jgi:hypothetical protein